jgi:hypothetical protein
VQDLKARRPVLVVRWTPTMLRRIEAIRDRIFDGIGTTEAVIEEPMGLLMHTAQWRKPLSIPEINRMAPTVEVRERRGRP